MLPDIRFFLSINFQNPVPFILLAISLPLLLGGCSKPSLEDSIVGKVITVALNERMQPQMGFNANGVMLVIGQDGNLEDRGLTYKIKGNEVLVFEDGERDGGLLFTSSSPKAGDQVEMGSEDGKRNVTIIKIETADEISP
ncbi:hypothetical protein OAF35_05615 [Verrucomicrobiales bacterium]|nr:hypothetical protein [Verrucomicrobiales bacterium]